MTASLRSYLGHFSTIRSDLDKKGKENKAIARDYIAKTFKDFGLDTWTEEFKIPSENNGYPGINVIGRVNGMHTGTSKDKILSIGAHYDSGRSSNGVDDNGSGMTALLQALAMYKRTNNAKCTQDYTLLFVAFDLEELGLLGSEYYVKNLTRHLNGTGVTVQGAFVFETMLNYNTTPNSQKFPNGTQAIFPNLYKVLQTNQFRGDFLAVLGRRYDDNELMAQFLSKFDQGRFKVMKVPLPFNGSIKALPPQQQYIFRRLFASDHTSFWNGPNSWPAILLSDSAEHRGYMQKCYHRCDDMKYVTPVMISFMGTTTVAVEGAAQAMTGRDCPAVSYCANDTLITTNEQSISSPLYPSKYPNGISCGWTRESEYPQKLVFESFDLENGTNCMNDYLEVIAGDKTVGRYCGSTMPEAITTQERKLRVRFVSDAFVSRKGFVITWSTNTPASMGARIQGFQSMVNVLMITAAFVFWIL